MPTTPPSHEPPRVVSDPRTERTRQAVIEAGMNLLTSRGPDAINHAAIASAAGVSRTTLYKYWPSRANLIMEILSAFDPHQHIVTNGDLRCDLLAYLRALRRSMSDPTRRRVFSSILARAQWDDDMNEAQNNLRALPLGDMEKLFDAAVERGELIDGVEPLAAAGRLIGPLVFAALIARDEVMTVDLESIVDDWLSGVRPDGEVSSG